MNYIQTVNLALTIVLLFTSCNTLENQQRYEAAVADAMIGDSSEIFRHLTAINGHNPQLIWKDSSYCWLIVVNWTKHPERYPAGDTVISQDDIWVTVVPELRTYLNSTSYLSLARRTEELLGLPPDANYTHFAEFWVKPTDLFRPSPDPEIDDSVAELSFREGTDTAHVQWFLNNMKYSYQPPRYPWTRLGYTYDWGKNSSEIGLSEFVIRPGSELIIKGVYPTNNYLSVD